MRLLGRSAKAGDGFTLVEMLVVVALMGLLTSIVAASVAGFKSSADSATCSAELSSLVDAEDAAMAATGGYLSESALVIEDFLREESDLYGITLSGTSSFTVTSTSSCTGGQAFGVTTTTGGTTTTSTSTTSTSTTSTSTTSTSTTSTSTTSTSTTTTTAPQSLVITSMVIASTNSHRVTVSGTAPSSGGSVTVVICKTSSFPCSGSNIANTFTATVAANGSWSRTSTANVDGGNRWARATQGSLTSNIYGPVLVP